MNKNTFYICSHCVDYKTQFKADIKKHLTKKKKCISFSEKYSFEEAYDLSLVKKYTFLFNYSNLEKKDYGFIVYNYTNIENQINEDFTNIDLITQNNNQKILSKIEKCKNNEIIENNQIIENSGITENNKINQNEEKQKYICYDCLTEYSSKRSLLKHLDNKSLCEYKKKYNEYLKKVEIEKNNNQLENIKNDDLLNNSGNIFNNIQNINNNIQNNNNNNNNNNTSNLHIKVNDFMNDRYDITHISDDFYKRKDFFLFNNFLEEIMLNKNNHNIYFIDNNTHAIIYTENDLSKVSSEKIGYIILEKIEQAFLQLYYKQNDEARQYYDFIHKYFRVIKGQYKHDTLYRVYDVNQQCFISTSNSNSCRARDRNLGKMIKIINKNYSETKNNLSKCSDGGEILNWEPNIEDFMSRRCRYKDLKS
jgi:hypothetical protein